MFSSELQFVSSTARVSTLNDLQHTVFFFLTITNHQLATQLYTVGNFHILTQLTTLTVLLEYVDLFVRYLRGSIKQMFRQSCLLLYFNPSYSTYIPSYNPSKTSIIIANYSKDFFIVANLNCSHARQPFAIFLSSARNHTFRNISRKSSRKCDHLSKNQPCLHTN